MGPRTRRSITTVAVLLSVVAAAAAITEWGSDRVYYMLLFAAVVSGLGAMGAHLQRSDRGLIAATRLQNAARRYRDIDYPYPDDFAVFTQSNRVDSP